MESKKHLKNKATEKRNDFKERANQTQEKQKQKKLIE